MDDPPTTSTRNSGKGDRGGGGGKSKNSNRAPPTREVQISKKLSRLLRHSAPDEGLALDAAGYANLGDVLANRNVKGMKVSFDEVREIVRGNDKQRFGMKLGSSSSATKEGEGGVEAVQGEESTNVRDWLIRANQGHSIKVESEGLLQPITLNMGDELPETVVHGTSHAAWTLIVASGGLRAMGRNHVHFASGLPATFKPIAKSNTEGTNGTTDDATTAPAEAAAPVISGMRTTSTILIHLSLRKALEAGIKFWRSENGVILSEGDAEGKVGMEFFERVEDRTGEGVLVEEGRVVKEAPTSWVPKGGDRGGRGGRRGRGGGRGG